MEIGGFRLEQLSEGIFEISPAGSIRRSDGLPGRNIPSPDAGLVGIDPVLIDTGRTCVLLDAGLGMGLDAREPDHDTSNIVTNLDVLGYRPEDITHVVLSHLHYDHAAGLSFSNKNGTVTATLPNAKIYVQRMEWEAALNSITSPEPVDGMGYETDDLYRLIADDRFVFLEKEREEVIDGISVLRTGGHTPGHQIVHIRHQQKTAYFCGDLIPNEDYLSLYAPGNIHTDNIKVRNLRMLLMQQAWREKATLLFYHSIFKKTGIITRDKHKSFVLKAN